jgi:hypothetical protein
MRRQCGAGSRIADQATMNSGSTHRLVPTGQARSNQAHRGLPRPRRLSLGIQRRYPRGLSRDGQRAGPGAPENTLRLRQAAGLRQGAGRSMGPGVFPPWRREPGSSQLSRRCRRLVRVGQAAYAAIDGDAQEAALLRRFPSLADGSCRGGTATSNAASAGRSGPQRTCRLPSLAPVCPVVTTFPQDAHSSGMTPEAASLNTAQRSERNSVRHAGQVAWRSPAIRERHLSDAVNSTGSVTE